MTAAMAAAERSEASDSDAAPPGASDGAVVSEELGSGGGVVSEASEANGVPDGLPDIGGSVVSRRVKFSSTLDGNCQQSRTFDIGLI